MPTGASRLYAQPPEYYWLARERELAKQITRVRELVEIVNTHQRALVAMWDTAKINQSDWEETARAAKQAMRNARAARTHMSKMIGHMQDTIRIRPHLAAAVTDHMRGAMDTAKKTAEYLEAHGY